MKDDFTKRLRELSEGRKTVSPSAEDDGESFQGVVPGRTQVALRVRMLNGQVYAFPYALLNRAILLPAGEVCLRFHGNEVLLRGRNLHELFDRIADQRLRVVEEREELHAFALPEDAAVVTKIEVSEE